MKEEKMETERKMYKCSGSLFCEGKSDTASSHTHELWHLYISNDHGLLPHLISLLGILPLLNLKQ